MLDCHNTAGSSAPPDFDALERVSPSKYLSTAKNVAPSEDIEAHLERFRVLAEKSRGPPRKLLEPATEDSTGTKRSFSPKSNRQLLNQNRRRLEELEISPGRATDSTFDWKSGTESIPSTPLLGRPVLVPGSPDPPSTPPPPASPVAGNGSPASPNTSFSQVYRTASMLSDATTVTLEPALMQFEDSKLEEMRKLLCDLEGEAMARIPASMATANGIRCYLPQALLTPTPRMKPCNGALTLPPATGSRYRQRSRQATTSRAPRNP